MRSSTRRRGALTLGALAAIALVWSGCDAKKQTEYVAGVSTQVQVPRDLKSIRMDVSVGGVVLFCRGYKVYDGKVQLPRSLGEFPQTGAPGPDPITVTVTGFTEEFSETDGKDVFANCTSVAPMFAGKDGKGGNGARILRRSRQPYVTDSVLFLPMPLKYSCFDKDCPLLDQTCKAGTCVDAKVDETKLPRFTQELLDGTGGACFSPRQCFRTQPDAPDGTPPPVSTQHGVPAVVVDPSDCTYAIPNTPSALPLAPSAPPNPISSAGDGVNVEVTYDGGYNTEILDKDPVEGFFFPDPTKPQRFRLAPGLCSLVKGSDPLGTHRITAVRTSGLCQAKGQFQPICAAEQLTAMGTDPSGVSATSSAPATCTAVELKPAKSALMVLADDTDNSLPFYANLDDQKAVNLSLSDPAFKQTDFGLTFFPGRPTSCGAFVNEVPFTPALSATSMVLKAFDDRGKMPALLNGTTEDVALAAAIADASTKLNNGYATANRRAILVIGNRGFDASVCATGLPAAAAADAKADHRVETYVVMLARDAGIPASTADMPLPPVVPGADDVAVAGSSATPPLGAFDARAKANKSKAQDAFRRIVEDLATCAYDVPVPLGADDVLSYSDPIALPPIQTSLKIVPPAAAGTCTTANGTGNGWGLDSSIPGTNRVRICGQACTNYRDTLKKAAAWSLQYVQPAIAVPVFSHKKACAPTP